MNDWKKVLITVDDTPTSDKGLEYAGKIIGHLKDIHICLLHVYPEPPPDYYRTGGSLDTYKKQREEQAAGLLERDIAILGAAGISEENISREIRMAEQTTISDAILSVQRDGGFGTVVVGKRGVSKAEEFLFGSISNALVHHSRDCTVWVVG
jgi:nucleotide-binding universal stress UspA family protein